MSSTTSEKLYFTKIWNVPEIIWNLCQTHLEMNYSLAKNCENFIVSWGIGNYGEIYVLQGEDLTTPFCKRKPVLPPPQRQSEGEP